MRQFPIFLDLQGRRALVVGQGEIADRKIAPLAAAGAAVVQSPHFDPAQLPGCAIAIGADAPEADLRALSAEAQRLGIPVNVVDRPELCSYITPALVDRDPITIAVSSGGAAPVLARLLRARIEAMVPPGFGRLAAFADGFKTELRRRLPDTAARRRVLERAFSGRVADLVFAGDEAAAGALFSASMAAAEAEPEPGIVFLVDPGPGEADLLTLRAHRLLGEADVIVHDHATPDAVLDMARRDATRLVIADATEAAAQVITLAQQGRKLVWLGRANSEGTARLQAAGVRWETVPGAR